MTNLAPSPDYPERPGNIYDKIVAQPKRNALGERAGERWAEDGTSWQPEYLSAFYGSVTDTDTGASHYSYDAKLADQAGGRNALGGGNPAPSWDAVPPEALSDSRPGASEIRAGARLSRSAASWIQPADDSPAGRACPRRTTERELPEQDRAS